MAKFKVGEKARFVGPLRNTMLAGVLAVGDEVTIMEDLQETEGNDGPEMVYVIDRSFCGRDIGCPPSSLEKIQPKGERFDMQEYINFLNSLTQEEPVNAERNNV